MRMMTFVVTGVLATCIAVPAVAAKPAGNRTPTYARCEALALQRGAGRSQANPEVQRPHRDFIAQCMAGKIPGMITPTPVAMADPAAPGNFDYCEALSIQRGSGPGAGGSGGDPEVSRTHRSFMAQCMAGKIR
jgi:hypothetical protein